MTGRVGESTAARRESRDEEPTQLRGIGCVVIGRNEGERLVRALRSVSSIQSRAVYVDSASSDGSIERAGDLGVAVCALDAREPLTAARGRNIGLAHVRASHPEVQLVQFLDGDTELAEGWLEAGAAYLESNPRVGVVCGVLREVHREQSVYRRLMDMEWVGEFGEIPACGGIFLARAEAVERAGMFDSSLPYGEEAELCLRIRAHGWTLVRINEPMGFHDSDMSHFRQWWTRCVRGGRGHAESVRRFGTRDRGANARRVVSCLCWGMLWPASVLAVATALATKPRVMLPALIVLLALPILQVARITLRQRERFGSTGALTYAAYCMLGKLPECWGVLAYLGGRLRRRHSA